MATQQQWHRVVADLLEELMAVQDELLRLLADKREAMVAGDLPCMLRLQPREQELGDRLLAVQQRRQTLLDDARRDGMACETLEDLLKQAGDSQDGGVGGSLRDAQLRSRLLQHHSLTNWVLAQKSLLHLAQLLEIIATGGRLTPTYGKGEAAHSRGSLVDEAA